MDIQTMQDVFGFRGTKDDV